MNLIEKYFETFLWRSKSVVIFAVLATLAASFGVFYMATIDAWIMLSHLGDYAFVEQAERNNLRLATIKHVVEIIDGYLLATVLLIFSLGLYELFISKIEDATQSSRASKVLIINNLDDLKGRLAKVILMILIVKFFENALNMNFATPLDMLYLAAGITLIGLALHLTHTDQVHHEEHNTK